MRAQTGTLCLSPGLPTPWRCPKCLLQQWKRQWPQVNFECSSGSPGLTWPIRRPVYCAHWFFWRPFTCWYSPSFSDTGLPFTLHTLHLSEGICLQGLGAYCMCGWHKTVVLNSGFSPNYKLYLLLSIRHFHPYVWPHLSKGPRPKSSSPSNLPFLVRACLFQ